MDFQHAKMKYMMELDNNIRYYRSGVLKVLPEEKNSVKQLIVFLSACKRLDLNSIHQEKEILKITIGNMLYEALESGSLSQEFLIIWKTTIHQANMFYNKCYILCEFIEGKMDEDEYRNEEKRSMDEMVEGIQTESSLEILIAP
jgi:hypothetical protein